MAVPTIAVTYIGTEAIKDTPVTGNQAARLITLSDAAKARGAIEIPAPRGNTFFKFGVLNTVDASVATTSNCIVEGEVRNVEIPAGSLYLSIISDNDEDYNLVLNLVK